METMNKSQEEAKTTVSEIKNTAEGMKDRLNEAMD